jgi:hypothetical protein
MGERLGDMDYENIAPHEVLSQIIENLAEAEGRMRAARDKMSVSFLDDSSGYESIVDHIDSALASAGAALSEAHHMLHEM